MSSNTPNGPSDGTDDRSSDRPSDAPSDGHSYGHSDGHSDGQNVGPEYLGAGRPDVGKQPTGRGGKWGVLAAAAVGVLGVVGVGGWVALSLMSSGTQPAEVIPANAVGYLSLDLDPSAAQKIEAFKILNKFPAIKREIDLTDRDDLREFVFTKLQDEGHCESLDYAQDIKPWIGDRIALAGVPGTGADDAAAPVIALQVTDQAAARTGIEAVADCAKFGDDFGFAFVGDYVLLSDSESRAEALVASAEKASLADDAQFQEWTEKVGDPGIITMYAAPGAPKFFADMQRDAAMNSWMNYGEVPSPAGLETGAAYQSESQLEMDDSMSELAKNFKGMAGVIRFEDGAVEAEFAGQGLPSVVAPVAGDSGPSMTNLPGGTGAAFSIALRDGWLKKYLESIAGVLGGGESVDQMLAEAEAETGLKLPEDIETLFGDGISLSVDAEFDMDGLFSEEDLSRLPIGLRVKGNPDEILPIVDKVKAAIGPDADRLVVESGEGVVAFGLNQDYVTNLVEGGALGNDVTFQNAVPDADEASGVLYVNFDAGGGWAERLAESMAGMGDEFSDKPARSPGENVAPLDALGLSSWVDSEQVQRARFRLTTD